VDRVHLVQELVVAIQLPDLELASRPLAAVVVLAL
jgi:hypothetical protein